MKQNSLMRFAILLLFVMSLWSVTVEAKGSRRGGYVSGYTRKDGTRVNGYYRGGSNTGGAGTTSSSSSSGIFTSPRPSSAPGAGKTVHVRSYYRKDGTFVRSYWRRPPGAGTSFGDGDSSSRLGSAPVPSSTSLVQIEEDDQHQTHLLTAVTPLESGISYVAGMRMSLASPIAGGTSYGISEKLGLSKADQTTPNATPSNSAISTVTISLGKEGQPAPLWAEQQKILVHFGQEVRFYMGVTRNEILEDSATPIVKVLDIDIPLNEFLQMSEADHILLIAGDVESAFVLSGERLAPLKQLAQQLNQLSSPTVTLPLPPTDNSLKAPLYRAP